MVCDSTCSGRSEGSPGTMHLPRGLASVAAVMALAVMNLASSYLRGPFAHLRIVLRDNAPPNSQAVPRMVRVDVHDRATIARLVRAINSLQDFHGEPVTCFGGLMSEGPAWLSFVRPNGTVVHAFELGPGVCLGLAVNGKRRLIDPNRVWPLIQALTAGRG
jgi:hypothetical protein